MTTGAWLTAKDGQAEKTNPLFHAETRLRDGIPGLLIDPGAVGNLSGSGWVTTQASLAMKHGRHPTQVKRSKPLDVSGVGQG